MLFCCGRWGSVSNDASRPTCSDSLNLMPPAPLSLWTLRRYTYPILLLFIYYYYYYIFRLWDCRHLVKTVGLCGLFSWVTAVDSACCLWGTISCGSCRHSWEVCSNFTSSTSQETGLSRHCQQCGTATRFTKYLKKNPKFIVRFS